MGSDAAQLTDHAAGAGRDEPSDDHILLQPIESIDLAVESGFGKNAGCFLEGCSRNERPRLQACLRDAEQHGYGGCWTSACYFRSAAFTSSNSSLSTCSFFQEIGVARVGDLDLLQHLPDDHLNMLVVDGDALQPVDFLDLIDEEGCQLFHAFDGQDVVRRRIAIENELALLDAVAFLNRQGAYPWAADTPRDRCLHRRVE